MTIFCKKTARLCRVLAVLLALCICCGGFPLQLSAEEESIAVAGKVYEFDEKNSYQFSDATDYLSSDDAEVSTYGNLSLEGADDVVLSSAGEKDGVPSYCLSDGSATMTYAYSDELLNAAEDEWHLIEDKEKSVDTFKLDSNIQKGAVILQQSKDLLNWHDVSVQTNAFEDVPSQNDSFYKTAEVDTLNGCFYRLVVVYELARLTESSKILGIISNDEYEYKRVAEVYVFYVFTQNETLEKLADNTRQQSIGSVSAVEEYDGYSGSKEMDKDDLHYGWSLGNFFVKGFTDSIEKDGQTVFLKNVGDEVALEFRLEQDINALNGDSKLAISADSEGYDQYFQTPLTDFGKGMLIIRYTDYENVQHESVMYSDFLEANASLNADTIVQLFEEGDYEVALDYEITRDQLLDKARHYRIFFTFSVRNANCMFFPFDVETGAELTNTAVTENGFYLDLAKSRYLKIIVKKEVWTDGADGLVEDTRFNTAAKDGDQYTDEGIYTITAKNEYTNEETTKKIYVGSDRILAAYVSNPDYTIPEIQDLVAQGAIIYEDGTIVMPQGSSDEEEPDTNSEKAGESAPEESKATADGAGIQGEGSSKFPIAAVVIPVVLVLLVIIILITKKHKKSTNEEKLK